MTKTLSKLRASNLQALINCFPENAGNRAAFCRKYGLDALQIGQYFTISKNARNLGERKAREIEEKIKTLRIGWLDEQHDQISSDLFIENPPAIEVSDFLSRMKKLQREYDEFNPEIKEKVDAGLNIDNPLEKFIKKDEY